METPYGFDSRQRYQLNFYEWGENMASKKGYIIACAVGSGFYVDDVEHIERDDSCIPWMFEDDEEAARAAEADGIKLIYGMQGVPDGVYVDTPETRAILANHVQSSSEQTSFFSPER